MKKTNFLKFVIITIGDDEIYFYLFDFLSPTVVEIYETLSVQNSYYLKKNVISVCGTGQNQHLFV